MNALQKTILRLVGAKSLYDLHPELLDRQPILRLRSDEPAELAGYASAADDYANHVWVNKAVSVLASNFAPLPVRVVADPDGDEVEGHPIAGLLAYVNDHMPPAELWRQWMVDMLLGGESGFEMVRSKRGDYSELWIRQPKQFTPKVNKSQARYGGVVSYRIEDTYAEPYEVPPEEFVHFKFYNPQNPWRGLAPISAVRMGILIDQFSQAWSRMFFKNGARPDIAIITPQGLTETERKSIEARFKVEHSGLENAHLPIVLEQGVTDIKPFTMPPKDLEWVKQRELSREEIGAIFGVPDEIMGWGRNTYENFEYAMKALWRITLLPLVGMRDSTLTRFFTHAGLLKAGQRVESNLSAVDILQEDRSGKFAQAAQLFGMGVPFNTINDKLNLDIGHVEGGDTGYLPGGLKPVGEPEPEPEPVIVPVPTPAIEPEQELEPEPEEIDDEEEPAEQEEKGLKAESVPFGGELHKALWLLFKGLQETRERAMQRLLKREFQAQQNRVAAALRERSDVPAVSEIFDYQAERQAWGNAFRQCITDTVAAGDRHAGDQKLILSPMERSLDALTKIDLTNPAVIAAIELLLWLFVDEVTEETQAEIASLLKKAVETGLAIAAIGEGLAALYDGFKGYRAERIARTETMKAFNYGTSERYRADGVKKRGWLATLDDRTRDEHASAHGTELPIDQPFTVGGEELMYPGDPNGSPENIINCRCTVYPVIEV